MFFDNILIVSLPRSFEASDAETDVVFVEQAYR